MNDAAAMRETEPVGDLRGDVQDGFRVQRHAGSNPVGEAAFFKIRHHEIRSLGPVGNPLDRHDARVPQPFQMARFLEKAVHHGLIRHQIRPDQLDRHLATGAAIPREQDNSHAPTAEQPQNFILIQGGQQTRTRGRLQHPLRDQFRHGPREG